MKKICIIISALALTLTFASCRNYDTRDGEYDYYNNTGFTNRMENGARRVTRGVQNGARRVTRGIENGANRAATSFDNAMGTNDIAGNGVNNY